MHVCCPRDIPKDRVAEESAQPQGNYISVGAIGEISGNVTIPTWLWVGAAVAGVWYWKKRKKSA